jgi:histone deacetylase complex regulatory component SIN3
VNYGDIFGTFLDGLGKAFDAKTSTDIKGEVRTAKSEEDNDEELKNVVKQYKKKRAFINMSGNGNKGKFDTYVVDTFLVGKSKKNWMDKMLKEKYETEFFMDEETRILLEETEEGIDWGQFFGEAKYWVYFISWFIKIGAWVLIKSANSRQKITDGQVKFIGIQRKIHFVLFNLISIDVAFIGTRTILHLDI